MRGHCCTSTRQDAGRLCRAILQSAPSHPDANHNLGVLAVSVNITNAAIPLFKTALEANPKIERFWISYIDALIKAQKFDDARQVIAEAKTNGVSAEKLNGLGTRPDAKLQDLKSPRFESEEDRIVLAFDVVPK